MRKKTIREKRSTAWSKAILSVCLVMLLIFSQSNIIAFSATVKPDLSGKTDVRAVPNTVLPEKGKLQSVEAMSAKAIASAEITVFTDIMVPSMRQLTFDGTEELSELETYGKGFRFQGSLGQTVHIRMDSADFDSYLFLYDSNKSLLTLDDDGGGNRNARIIYTLPSNGDYYIVATQWFYPPDEPGFTGNATFSVGYVDNTLTYDTNGSASSSWSEMFEANLPVPITTVIPQAPAGNYLFRGWTAQKVDVADGANYSGTIYQPTGSITLTNNATLYALWAYCGGPTPLPFEVKSNLADSGTWSPYTGEKGFCYSFSLSTGQVLAVTMTTVNILPVLVLYNAEGEVVASYEGTSLSAWINYDVKTSGTYYLYATSDYLSPYIDGEFTLSAETSSNSATLIYDANGGFAAPPSVTVIANSEFYLSKETPLNNGYFFLGWSTSQSAVTATYGPGDQFNMVLPSLTLYAVWKAYTPVEQFPFSVSGSLSNGDGWSLNAAWMKGYSFYAPAGSIVVVTMKSPNSDSFLYLLDANSAVVAYNDDYGGNLDSRVSFTVQTGGTYYLQATTFSKQPSDFTLNISLETPRVITYDTQGGSPTPPQQEVAVGGYDYVSGEIPIRLGYTFLGWNTNPSGNGVYYEHNERLAIGGDMVLYAIWAQHVNTVATISSPSYTVAQITQTSPLLVQETSLSSRYAAYRVWLTAEQYTTIHMESNDFDSLLYLLDPNGQYITNDDDSGGNSNAYIEYFVPSDGWYYILTSQWQDSEGSYVLSVGTLPTLSAGSVVAGAGNTIEIPVMASGSPSLSSLKFDVAYESSALKLTDVTLPNGSGFSVLFVPNPGNEMISLSPKGTDSISPNGVLLTITFEISENAAVGNHLISLQNIKASDEKDSPIQFSAESGSVEVIRYGDANGDNLVNGFDVQALVLWINAGRPAGGIDEVSARITGVSGRPDGFDVQALVLWVNSGGDPNVGHPGPYAVTAQSTSGLVTPFSIAAASAEADLTIEVESKTASPGDTNVEVPIMITYNPGVSVISDLRIDLGAGLTLYYPQGEAAYAAGFATWPYIAGNRYQGEGEGMIPTMGRPTNLNIGNSHIVFNFQDTTEPFNSLETGMLVTLRLTVDAAASGNIPITISGGLYDSIPSQGARTPVLVSGYVSVSGGTVLGGLVTITGVAKYNETLTADTTRLTTEPAGADTGALSYQWKRGGVDIVGANSATYTLAAADIGQTITVTVTAANCAGEVTSAPVPPIAKADGPAAPVAPTMASKTTTSVTLEIIPGAEYRLGTTGAWQTSPTFDGLNPNTGYVFFARIAETATHEASITSDGTTVTTNDQTLPYTVEYYYDGVIDNSLTETKSVSAASPIVTSASITDNLKAGYKADTPQYVPALPTTITLTENVIRVYYVAVLWTVTFDLAGGTRTGGGELTQTIPLGGAAIAPIATRSGYTFIGWDKTFDNVTSDITVTAQWSAISYTVTYKANGGTGVDVTSIVVYDQEYEVAGNSFTPPTGYNFGGWNTVANGTGTAYAPGDKITIKDDVTLYAQWVPENNLKITYNANTGTGTMADQTVTYDSNVTLTANAFSKSGYVFDGWNTQADGTGTGYANSATFKYEVDGDLTLYAQWEPKYDLKIIYNANTGTGTMADQTVTYDSNVTLTANAFSKTGYVFNAWNTQADGTGTAYADSETFKYEIDGDLTLYAQWMPENSLKITYNANTGTGTMADQTVTYDSNVTLTANAFSKTG
ncbi:MAG: InlB B-repeat-containing protein, partial [Oscillospiraceae bacterium]|nr:InlB B-repeat-containing protein [Oscillospiraceae bacterium]